MDLILAVWEIQDVELSVFGPMQLTAKRNPWKLMIEKIPGRKQKLTGEHFYLKEICKMLAI